MSVQTMKSIWCGDGQRLTGGNGGNESKRRIHKKTTITERVKGRRIYKQHKI